MADEGVKFSEFPIANQSKDSDSIAILQDGINKMMPTPVLESKVINKTVSKLLDEGNIVLDLINLKGTVSTYPDLNLIIPTPEINDAYQVLEGEGLVYVMTTNGFQPNGFGFNFNLFPSGAVNATDNQAVSGKAVYDGTDRRYRTAYLNNTSAQVIINQATKTFTIKSGISVVRGDGRFLSASDYVLTYEDSVYALFFNTETLQFETVLQTNVQSRYREEKYSLIGVFRSLANKIYLNGITNYTLDGTEFPLSPSSQHSTYSIYNRNFSQYRSTRTESEKEWMNKAIIHCEFYNIRDNQTVTLYALGKGYLASGNRTNWLGFFVGQTGVAGIPLYVDEFNNTSSTPYIEADTVGIKTYYLRNGTHQFQNNSIYGKIIIDWDAIPLGARILEANSNVIVNNSLFLREKYVRSYKYNVEYGIVKFAKSKSFFEYFNSPTIESYASASGVASAIPKAPYEKIENWYLKWDELMANLPLGYEITKEVLTTQVPTNTTVSGFLPIYSYSFKPNKIRTGDSTTNSAQTLPKILIDCSIHGFEKTPSFITYEFMKLVLNEWRTNPFLEYLRFNVEFVIIPSMNPHGWNALNGAGTRTNFNGVDLNRNNKIGWFLNGTVGDPTYSGPYALSEIETQVFYDWMIRHNTGNVIIGMDFHNFHGVVQSDPKLYNMFWIISKSSELGQSCANVLYKELSVKFKEKSSLIPQTDDYFVGSCNNTVGRGDAAVQYKELGATYACTFEVSQNFRFNPNFKGFDTDVMTFGMEGLVNMLRVYTDNFIDEYNQLRT